MKSIFVFCVFILSSSYVLADEVFLDCPSKVTKTIGDIPEFFKKYESDGYLFKIDLDMKNKTAKLPGWSSKTFVENPENPNEKLYIDANDVLIGRSVSLGGEESFKVERTSMKFHGMVGGNYKGLYALVFEGVCSKVENRANPDAKF